MGLRLSDSETFGYLAKKRDIEIARKMYLGGMDVKEILSFIEISEEEFIKKVVNRVKRGN
jgi:hypothetical protein